MNQQQGQRTMQVQGQVRDVGYSHNHLEWEQRVCWAIFFMIKSISEFTLSWISRGKKEALERKVSQNHDQQCRENDCDSVEQRGDSLTRHISKEEFSKYSAWACTEFSTQAIMKVCFAKQDMRVRRLLCVCEQLSMEHTCVQPANEVTQREEAPGKWLYKNRSKEGM